MNKELKLIDWSFLYGILITAAVASFMWVSWRFSSFRKLNLLEKRIDVLEQRSTNAIILHMYQDTKGNYQFEKP